MARRESLLWGGTERATLGGLLGAALEGAREGCLEGETGVALITLCKKLVLSDKKGIEWYIARGVFIGSG